MDSKHETAVTNRRHKFVAKPLSNNTHFIELRYVHCDGSSVKGAAWHVRSVPYSGNGVLDENGFVRIDGLPEIPNFTYWFDADPGEYRPAGPKIISQQSEVKAHTVSALDAVGDWIWGTVQGDFNKNQSVSQIAVNTILGLIPLVDQTLDLRDIISGSKDIIEFYGEEDDKQRSHEDILGLSYEEWLWVSIFLIALGCIPEIGSAVKGVLKGLIRELQDAMKTAGKLSPKELRHVWEQLIKILNYLGVKPGNANRWLKEMCGKLGGWMDQAATQIRAALDSIGAMVDQAERYAREYGGKKVPLIGEILSADAAKEVLDRIKNLRNALGKAYNRLDQMKAQVNKWIREQLDSVIQGKHSFESFGSANVRAEKSGTNVRMQEEIAAPEFGAMPRRKSVALSGLNEKTKSEILSTPKGEREFPERYMTEEQLARHREKFYEGASFFTDEDTIEYYANKDYGGKKNLGAKLDNVQFVMPKRQMDDLLKRTRGDISAIEKELGIEAGKWKGKKLVRIDVEDPWNHSVRMPSGNESLADKHLWIPGGKTPTGIDEAVIDVVPEGMYMKTPLYK